VIVDTSALMAVLLSEPEADRFLAAMMAAPRVAMSAGNAVELTVTTTRRTVPIPPETVNRLVASLGITIEPVTVEQAEIARRAYLTYGRGRHPAALNYGDCFAYALARALDRPLLFKGNDFSETDIAPAATA
jgi:ribonuclease VapC